jgi:hypothetical protein
MSSKQQFKEALKGDKKIIAELNESIRIKNITITRLSNNITSLNTANELLINKLNNLRKRKWYHFWK